MGHVERRKRETLIQFLWHTSDTLGVLLAFLIGYWLRFKSPLVGVLWDLSKGVPPLLHYLIAAIATILVWFSVFHSFGLYQPRLRWHGHVISTFLKASLFGMVLTAGIAFFYRDVTLSRIAIPLIWMIAIPILHLGRLLSFRLAYILVRGRALRFLVVGRTPQGYRIARALIEGDGALHEAVGILAGPGEDVIQRDDDPLPILGSYDDVGEIVQREKIDRVIAALPLSGQEGLIEVMRQCKNWAVDVEFVPDIFSLISQDTRFEEIDGVPIASLREIKLAGWNGVLKRTLDLVLTVPAVVLLSPVLGLLALIIKLASPGPVFYRQERVGRDRRVFHMIKFRSMRVDAENNSGPVWADTDDPRRTRVGTFLRTWSIDELPQLFNVLKGDMSLVGPRPERPYFVEKFEEYVPGYFDRHRVKSGITGWAQVNGLRGNVPIESRTKFDLYYVENWSIAFDLRILVLTLRSIIAQRGQ
jgi:exopolysaccharide biosynthesis polyprenyl glycosylphosphotransferase